MDTVLERYPVGGGKLVPVDHSGPASYPAGGETLGAVNSITGLAVVGLGGIDAVLGGGSFTESGNYWVSTQQTGTGSRKTWKLVWFAVTYVSEVLTLTQVTATTNLSAETVRLVYVGR